MCRPPPATATMSCHAALRGDTLNPPTVLHISQKHTTCDLRPSVLQTVTANSLSPSCGIGLRDICSIWKVRLHTENSPVAFKAGTSLNGPPAPLNINSCKPPHSAYSSVSYYYLDKERIFVRAELTGCSLLWETRCVCSKVRQLICKR